ncbi:hypothetical protein Poly21_16510 [Allorhodopirellula heiligendammensis]|uniref:Uncharacterized protein n=1 Tax=Allorhodopirellula heiligendammensis TaxID=2714739 RepID=A0A5C6C5P7_9BACT|nr:hypothetical protein Poly21_16510 [Allorhodopirellula heiligendammensis]
MTPGLWFRDGISTRCRIPHRAVQIGGGISPGKRGVTVATPYRGGQVLEVTANDFPCSTRTQRSP